MDSKKYIALVASAFIATTTTTALAQKCSDGKNGPYETNSPKRKTISFVIKEPVKPIKPIYKEITDKEQTVKPSDNKHSSNGFMNELHNISVKREKKADDATTFEDRQKAAGVDFFQKFIRDEEKKYINLALSKKTYEKKCMEATNMLHKSVNDARKLARKLRIATTPEEEIKMIRDSFFTDTSNFRTQITEACYAEAGYEVKASIRIHPSSLTETTLYPNPSIPKAEQDKIIDRIEDAVLFIQDTQQSLAVVIDFNNNLLKKKKIEDQTTYSQTR